MPYTYSKLKGKITEVYGAQYKFAEALGVSQNSVSKKLNCKTGFCQEEIIKWSKLLNISSDEYGVYFFT